MSEEESQKPSYEDLARQNAELERTLEETMRRCNAGTTAMSIMAGMTHDIKNPLMVVRAYGDLMMNMLDAPDIDKEQLKEYVADVISAANRMSEMTNHVLSSIRTGVYEKKEIVSITDLIDSCVHAVEASTPNIEYKREYGDNIYQVEADSSQLRQMMTNLFVNGTRAMPDGGRLDIRVNNYYGSVGKLSEGDYVSIDIHDNGMGIPEEHREKIFEPFFTIGNFKQVGTGLGLAVVSAIIGKHKGYITVSSTEGLGTTFNIFLPKYQE